MLLVSLSVLDRFVTHIPVGYLCLSSYPFPLQAWALFIDSHQIYIGIKDQGIGIAEKNLSKIFNEFFRFNNAVDFHNNGTGPGLSSTKEIAVIHNTNIQAESVLNQGSCFSVIFQLV